MKQGQRKNRKRKKEKNMKDWQLEFQQIKEQILEIK